MFDTDRYDGKIECAASIKLAYEICFTLDITMDAIKLFKNWFIFNNTWSVHIFRDGTDLATIQICKTVFHFKPHLTYFRINNSVRLMEHRVYHTVQNNPINILLNTENALR